MKHLALFLVAAAGLCSLLGFLGSTWWAFDLLSHFRLQYAAVLTVAMALALLRRRTYLAGVALGLIALDLGVVDGAGGGAHRQPTAGPPLSALLANVNSGNHQHEALLDYVYERRPTVIGLLEINARWEADLDSALADYPHRLVVPREDNFGLALYSRSPLLGAHEVRLGPGQPPSLVARLEPAPGGPPIHTILTHPVPPVGGSASAARDEQLRALARQAGELEGEVVILGDLNATPWSHGFAPLFEAGLTDTRAGFGYQGTWPAQMPLLLIPLDHCLTTPGLVARYREVGPDIGSDHLPVYVELVRAR